MNKFIELTIGKEDHKFPVFVNIDQILSITSYEEGEIAPYTYRSEIVLANGQSASVYEDTDEVLRKIRAAMR